jgi:DNA polymerase-3 subunit epsilon
LSIGAVGIDGNTISVKDSLELFMIQTVLKRLPIHGILKKERRKITETEE